MSKLAKRSVANSPVGYVLHGPSDQPTGLSLSLNYEQAPVPERYYVANWCNVVEQDLEVVISFGELIDDGKDLRSRIDIVFPSLLFVDQLWKSSREFEKLLRQFLDTMGSAANVGSKEAKLRSDKLQRLKSNNVFMILQATECLMDFYYISPKDLWSKPRRGEPLDTEAVVRVMLSPSLLLGFFITAEPIANRLAERFKTIRKKEDTVDEDMEFKHAR